MATIGYRASGVGERDLARGYEYIDGLRKIGGFPFLSGNVLYQKTGKPVFDPWTIVEYSSADYRSLGRETLKVGITSFVRFNPTFLKPTPSGDNMMLSSPMEEAKQIIPELRAKCDYLVVLASMPRDDAHLIARSIPGIDLIVAAYGGIVTGSQQMEGNTRIVYVGNQGKYLGEIRAQRGPQRWETTHKLHYLGGTYPEDAVMKETVAGVLKKINETNRNLAKQRALKQRQALRSAAAAASARPRQTIYRGSEVCEGCHVKEYGVWKGSRHSHAFDILVEKNADFNPECVGCHVVGHRKRGGFVDALNTPELVHVQCESCHGPAANHPEDPTLPYGRAGGQASCLPCHTQENSPLFNFASYWKKVAH